MKCVHVESYSKRHILNSQNILSHHHLQINETSTKVNIIDSRTEPIIEILQITVLSFIMLYNHQM